MKTKCVSFLDRPVLCERPDVLADPKKGFMILLDTTADIHAGFRIPADAMTKCIAWSMILPELTTKTWTGSGIPKDFTTKGMAGIYGYIRSRDIHEVANMCAGLWSMSTCTT